MPNYFTDNKDLQFVMDNLDLTEIISMRENDFENAKECLYAPENHDDAMDNYKQVLTEIGKLCAEKIEPRARTIDEEGPDFNDGVVTYHPLTRDNLNDLKNAGVMGVMLPHKYGGLNFPNTVYTMMTEMVSRADGSLQNLFGLQDISETIFEFGTEEQKDAYLPGFASGEYDGSMDLTEPDSGSDLQSVRLKATQDPKTGKWYLNGMKRFITNGCAHVHLVLARTEEGSTDGRGLSMFICEKCPELLVRRIEHKHGIHGVATCELQYNNVPAELCGLRKRGLTKYVMSLMNGARIAISGQALGIAEAAYFEAKKYAAEREQFKQSIDKFPAVYDMLASMKVKLLAARTLLYETTKIVDLKNCYTQKIESLPSGEVTNEDRDKLKKYTKLAAILTPMSKAYCTEIGNQVCYDGLQIHGGTGYMHDFNAERFSRDVRITNIYEGTTQLQIVAAIGGVTQRVLDPVIEELASVDGASPSLERMLDKLGEMHSRFQEAVAMVKDKKDPVYQNLMARALVDMETIIFISYLMIRDAVQDSKREALVEIFIFNNTSVFEAALLRVKSEDFVVIDKHKEVIEY